MATLKWIGNGAAVAQVDTCPVGGTIDALNTFTFSIPDATTGKSLTVVGGSTSAATVAATLRDAFNACTYPEFQECIASISGSSVLITARIAGKPFTLAVSKAQGAGATNTHTFSSSTTTTNTGPNDWTTATNWSTGAIPVDSDDLIIEDTPISILYGIAQSGIQPASLTLRNLPATFQLGNLNLNPAGYNEYRGTYLAIGPTTLKIQNCASPLIKINLGTDQVAATVENCTGVATEVGSKAIILKGTHASNTLTVNGSSTSVDVAPFAGETAVIATLKVDGGDVRCGSGTTLTTITKTGGTVDVSSNFTTLVNSGGDFYCRGSATGTTITIEGGTFYEMSSGTKTTVNITGTGVANCEQLNVTRTWTTVNLYKGASLFDQRESLSSLAAILKFCSLADVNLRLGSDITLTRS